MLTFGWGEILLVIGVIIVVIGPKDLPKLIKQFSKLIKFKLAYQKANADYYIDFRIRSRFWMELLLKVFV